MVDSAGVIVVKVEINGPLDVTASSVVNVDVRVVVGLVTTLHVLLSTTFLTSERLEKFHA